MKQIQVETIDGMKTETVYSVEDVRRGIVPLFSLMMSCKDSKKRGRGNSRGIIRYLEIPCAFDIETTTITDDREQLYYDSDMYSRLRSLKIKYNDKIKNDIPDFDYYRKMYFNQIHLSKTTGTPVDVLYNELSEDRPDLFPADVLSVSDMLLKIFDVYDLIKPRIDDFRPYAFMYHWQFCIAHYVIFGRTWKEFSILLSTLSMQMDLHDTHRLVVYVHNLSFEFQFMHRFLNVSDGFFKDERKPVNVLTAEGIEFRDSYILSNMSLAKFCENESGVIHYKLSGDDFDYTKIRTAATELTEKEQAYCYNDVRGLAECIASRMMHDTLAEMPMTSTGYVRRDFRNAMKKEPANRKIFINGKYDAGMYALFRSAFRGGDTHANIRLTGQIIHDVQSFDIASSYPAVMVTELFPMGAFKRISNRAFKCGYCERHNLAYIARFRLYDVKLKRGAVDPYIPFSQCVYVEGHTHGDMEECNNVYDNGRIIRAEAIEIVLTDIDWEIVRDCYTWSRASVREVYAAGYGYLPDEFRDQVKEYFKAKTELKGISDKYYEYMRSKNRINSAYGMMVQKINEEEVTYNRGEYEITQLSLPEQIEKYFKNRNNFLLYPWGVWVTAHARKRLHEGIKAVGSRAVYWDTDSVKAFGADYREAFDKLNETYKKMAIDNGALAYDRKGNCHYMGIFEYEETYNRFITLGAKKYLVEGEDGQLHSTIAGVSKKAGQDFFIRHGMEAFKAGTVIHDSGHLIAYYNDDEIHRITIDGCTMETASNLALVNDTYTLGITSEYADLLEKALNNKMDMIYTD